MPLGPEQFTNNLRTNLRSYRTIRQKMSSLCFPCPC